MNAAKCADCDARIYWTPSMATGTAMPLEVRDDGNVLVELDSDRACVFGNAAEARHVRETQPGRWWAATYASHHMSCPAGESRRGRPRPNPGQGSLL